MLFRETLRSALRSLLANRLRTALTALGMVIGVAAVIAVLAIGEGARTSVEQRIRALGSNLVTVRPASSSAGGVRGGAVTTLLRTDAAGIATISGVRAVSPEASGSAQVAFRERNESTSILGVTESYFTIRSLEVASGLPLSEQDERSRRRVVVLGANRARELFGDSPAVGERVQIKGIAFVVSGVLEAKGDSGFSSPDDSAFVPLAVHQSVLFGKDYVDSISIQVAEERLTDDVVTRVGELLRLRHRLGVDEEDDFDIRTQAEMLATMGQITATFTMLLGSVAAVSLLVGGIGIMNIMLVSVRERTREIGVRMAVGARRRDVLLQFLIEAVVVSIAGGLVGILCGFGASALVASLAGWTTSVPAYAVALALAVSIGIGIVFGVGPARSAARLDPVEALRHE